MASITELLNKLKSAMLGKDVRNTIADAIQQCYADATQNTNANSEVAEARGSYSTLNERLNNIKTIHSVEQIQAQIITPGATNKILPKDRYLTGDQTILGDINLDPSNILRGKDEKLVNIFGVQGTVDRIRRIDSYKGGSGYYGYQVADVARSYHLARMNGTANFKYSQLKNPFNGQVTNEDGYCVIDCSGFTALCLRGIDYINSPFYQATGTPNKNIDTRIIPQLCFASKYAWADEYLDKQTDPSFKDLGYTGYRSVRTAAQIAEYYYSGNGSVVHEFDKSPTSVPSGLMPGDLIFWSKPDAGDYQRCRFKAISHVGIVSRDRLNYFQATGYEESKGDTIFCSSIETHLEHISLILRPNYNPRVITTTPINMNLFPKYRFDSCGISPSVNISNVLFSPKVEGGIDVQGNPSADATFYIYSPSNTVTLTKGTYELSGAPIHDQVDVNSHDWTWGITLKKENGDTLLDKQGYRVWDRGKKITFDITTTTKIYAYISIDPSLTSTKKYTFNPSLVKIS